MNSRYSRQGEYKTVDLDGLWTGLCVFATLLILYLTLSDNCEQPLRLWLVCKCLALTLRLALKSTFPGSDSQTWYKFGIYGIKGFSVVWIFIGFYWWYEERRCSKEPSWIYVWVLVYIIVFS